MYNGVNNTWWITLGQCQLIYHRISLSYGATTTSCNILWDHKKGIVQLEGDSVSSVCKSCGLVWTVSPDAICQGQRGGDQLRCLNSHRGKRLEDYRNLGAGAHHQILAYCLFLSQPWKAALGCRQTKQQSKQETDMPPRTSYIQKANT